MTGAERVEGAIRAANAEGRAACVAFLTAGDPDLDRTAGLVAAARRGGADVIELGVPWSDPVADGPTIQRSAERARASGTTLAGVLDRLPEIVAAAAPAPVVLFGYVNPILRLGPGTFAERAEAGGACGVLVTDLPPEEAGPVAGPARDRGLATIFLAAPTSTDARLLAVARASTGFVYAVSRTGVTGARASLEAGAESLVGRLRPRASIPIAVGFGISRPEHVARVAAVADAYVVGSALVDLVARHAGGAAGEGAVEEALAALAVRARRRS